MTTHATSLPLTPTDAAARAHVTDLRAAAEREHHRRAASSHRRDSWPVALRTAVGRAAAAIRRPVTTSASRRAHAAGPAVSRREPCPTC